MKSIIKLVTFIIFLAISIVVNAQTAAEQKQLSNLISSLPPTTAADQKKIDSIIKTLPPFVMPAEDTFPQLCSFVDLGDVLWRVPILKMAGVLVSDSRLVAKAKVQRLWKSHYIEFGCDSPGFSVQYGNIFKFAIHRGYSQFIGSMVDFFGVSVNEKDPSDGKTLLDFVQDEIVRFSKINGQQSKVDELKKEYSHLKNVLGAKHSSELK